MLRRTLHVFRHRDRWTVREGDFVYATTTTLADAEAAARLAGGPYAILCIHGTARRPMPFREPRRIQPHSTPIAKVPG